MAAARSKTDVFPIHPVSEVRRLPRKPNFSEMISKRKVYAFIVYMEEEIIYCKPVQLNERYQKHFVDTGAYIKRLSEYFNKPWSAVARRLKRPIEGNLRKNIDCRTCFKYGTHYFLVKSCYTPGQRTVQRGQKHILQIGAVQMAFYFVRPEKNVRRREKLFAVKEQFKYTYRNLEPHTAYEIPERTTYILLATEYSFFSVHVMSAAAPVPFSCIDARRLKRPAAAAASSSSSCTYARPPSTPMIEDAVIGDEEEEVEMEYEKETTDVNRMSPPLPPPADVNRMLPPPLAAVNRMSPPPPLPAVVNRMPPPPPPLMMYENVTPPPPVVAVVKPSPAFAAAVEPSPAFAPPPLPPPPPAPIFVDLEAEPEPPAASSSYHVTVATMPLEKCIQVVTPAFTQWYQDHFKWRKTSDPENKIGIILDWGGRPEVLDLSNKGRLSTASDPSMIPTPAIDNNVSIPTTDIISNELEKIITNYSIATPSATPVNQFIEDFPFFV